MICPKCFKKQLKVVDSRSLSKLNSIRRRRECEYCDYRFTTYEYIQSNPIIVIKKMGEREEYDRKKIEKSFEIACNKLPISQKKIIKVVDKIDEEINDLTNFEVKSTFIGELIMDELKNINKIAYIRFASVYREFEDLGEFKKHIDDL